MSLVGPRPLKMEYLALYSEKQARRHDVRPGITGLHRSAGAISSTGMRALKLDVFYAANVSWRLDLMILLKDSSAVCIGKPSATTVIWMCLPLPVTRSSSTSQSY
jgi:lipopolysaccharide/colanic/teichoic acid biosynthesis glycosyltransferase